MLKGVNVVKSNDSSHPETVKDKNKYNSSSNPDVSVNCKRMNLSLRHPQRSIVASLGNDRLGNQMCNFAFCYALMKEYGMYHFLDGNQLKILENVIMLPKIVDNDDASYYLWDTSKKIISWFNRNLRL